MSSGPGRQNLALRDIGLVGHAKTRRQAYHRLLMDVHAEQVGNVPRWRSIVVRICGRSFIFQEMLGIHGCRDCLKRQGGLVEVETIRKVAGVGGGVSVGQAPGAILGRLKVPSMNFRMLPKSFTGWEMYAGFA